MSYSTIVTLGKTISIFKFDLSWEHVWYVWFTSLSQLHKRFIKGSPPVQYFIMMHGKHVFQMLECGESWGQALSWSYAIDDTHLERIHLHIFSCNVLCNTTKIKRQMQMEKFSDFKARTNYWIYKTLDFFIIFFLVEK